MISSSQKRFLSLFAVFTFAIILFAGIGSALTFGTSTSNHPLNVLTPNSDVSISLTSNEEVSQEITLSFENVNFVDSVADLTASLSDGNVVFSSGVATPFMLNSSESKTIIISVSKIKNTLNFGTTSTGTLKATSDQPGVDSKTKTINHFKSFCKSGPISPFDDTDHILEITKVNIDNNGQSDDSKDDVWFAFDEIDVEIKVENRGDDSNSSHDLNDLFLEIGLINSAGKNVIRNFEFLGSPDEEEEDIGDMDPDDKETVTFTFRLEESDKDLDGNFDFVVKVYEQGKENSMCIDFSDDLEDNNDFSQRIELERETDEEKFVRFNDLKVNPLQATCGEPVSIEADVVNIGDDKAENVVIILRNDELGVNLDNRLSGSLDEGEQDSVSFDFLVPEDLKDGSYKLILTSEYEVDDDEVISDVEEGIFLTLIGCEFTNPPVVPPSPGVQMDNAIVSASLSSDAKPGQELIVTATVTNAGSESNTFIIDATGYESWASLDSISKRILNLVVGQSATTVLKFNVKENSCDAQSFLIETTSNGKVELQEVEVNINCSSGKGITGFAGLDLGNSNLLWVIAIVNVILIILIILVAVRLSRG